MTSCADLVPLNLSGTIGVPRTQLGEYRDQAGRLPRTEQERVDWLAARLDRQLNHPLTAPGSEVIARRVLGLLPRSPLEEFAKKLLLTLRDGEMHSLLAIRSEEPHVGLCFVAWRGRWREVTGRRFGVYLSSFFETMVRAAKSVGSLAGYLQVDAYIYEEDAREQLSRDLEERVALDVEYSYFPCWPLEFPRPSGTGLPNAVLLNPDLCSDEEKATLASLALR